MDAAVSMGDFMRPIINPHLTLVNPCFIPIPANKIDNQPMVNEFSKILLRLKNERRESWAKIGEAAGVSAQAAHKWGAGGNIADDQLEKLAEHFGMSKSALKYGEADQVFRPPVIEAEEWKSLSEPKREFIEMVASGSLSDSEIQAVKSMLVIFRETAGGAHKQSSNPDPQIIDPTLPDRNEFTEFKDQRHEENRAAQKVVKFNRRHTDRGHK